ncbi:hypothetical protein MMC25_003534 [Agyrium rufum]|nr:hypothetical protein [Agyrium rufum]
MAPSVEAFVFTSSGSHATPYENSKAAADVLVRDANGKDLWMVCLRLCLVLRERDNSCVPLWMDAPPKVQIGANMNVMEWLSVENAVAAHLLVARALLDPNLAKGKVDGEAFNITNRRHVPFWDLSRLIWGASGKLDPAPHVVAIPAWMKPQNLNELVILYCINNHTYNVDEAGKVLGYKPMPSHLVEIIGRSVELEAKRRAGSTKGSKKS